MTAGTPVYLTVYDLDRCWNAAGMHQLGLGLYRTGIEIDGLEYTFDSDNGSDGGGVCWHRPFYEDATVHLREKRLLGRTALTADDAHVALRELAQAWRAAEYHSLERSCHHWCAAAAEELGLGVPRWIHGLLRLLCLCTDGGASPLVRDPATSAAQPLCRGEDEAHPR